MFYFTEEFTRTYLKRVSQIICWK